MILIIDNRIKIMVRIIIIQFGVIKLCQKIEEKYVCPELLRQDLNKNHGFFQYFSLFISTIDFYAKADGRSSNHVENRTESFL